MPVDPDAPLCEDQPMNHPTDQDDGLEIHTDQGDFVYHAPSRPATKPAPPTRPEPTVLVPDENGECQLTITLRPTVEIHRAACDHAPAFRCYTADTINAEHVAQALSDFKWYGGRRPNIFINPDDVPTALQSWGHRWDDESTLTRAANALRRLKWALKPPFRRGHGEFACFHTKFLDALVAEDKRIPRGEIAICEGCNDTISSRLISTRLLDKTTGGVA